jgi:hypothetical protein
MRKILDLNVREINEYARAAWILYRLNPISAKLIYYGLSLEFDNPRLLLTLADLLVEDIPPLSACTYHYLYTSGIEVSTEERKSIDSMYASAMWIWKLSKRKDGEEITKLGSFYDQSQFKYDYEGFKELISAPIQQAGSLKGAVVGARVFVGCTAGFLEPRDKNYAPRNKDFFLPERFLERPEYQAWIESSAEEIERLEKLLSKKNK